MINCSYFVIQHIIIFTVSVTYHEFQNA